MFLLHSDTWFAIALLIEYRKTIPILVFLIGNSDRTVDLPKVIAL
ncbi:MAG: hypothetical protein WBA89_29935 [Microcoleus sp.]